MKVLKEKSKKKRNRPNFCPVCSAGAQFTFIVKIGESSLFECHCCNVQFWTPFQNPGYSWYEGANEYEVADVLTPSIYKKYHKTFLSLHKTFAQKTRVLDIGCGTGEFLNELKKRGCETWGVDFDRKAITIAKKHFQIDHTEAMSFLPFFQRSNLPLFDIITLFEVIEHIDNPFPLLQEAAKHLKTNGIIVISTPNRERFFPNLSPWDFPPHHLTRWNKKALLTLFNRIGFEASTLYCLDRFSILAAALHEQFRIRLVSRVARLPKTTRQKILTAKTLRIFAKGKERIIGGLPALFFLGIGKISGTEGGRIYLELKRKDSHI